MRTTTTRLFAILTLSLAAAACGSSSSGNGASSTPTPGSYTLADGNYVYDATSATPNTCWAASKNMPPMPTTINATATSTGNTVALAFTAQGQSVNINLTKTDNALAGSTAGDVDLSSYGISCKLHVTLDMNGTMTANDAFNASEVLDVTDDGDSGCGLLIGNTDPHQFDQIPCSFTLNGSATKQ